MRLILEIIGTIAFAVSGAMVGAKAKMDIFGVTVLGLTTAVGGGIIRDLLIGVIPPVAFQMPVYALVAIAVSLIVFIPAIRNRIDTDSFVINLVDAVGLGVFTVTGVQTGAAFNNAFLSIFLGAVTGVGGGVLRDIFAMRQPVIFVKRVYALASLAGAALCTALMPVSDNIAMLAGAVTVVVIRVLAAKHRWNLPKAN